jgi:alpha-ribazole phosphatase
VAIERPDPIALGAIAERLPQDAVVLSSPLRRCRQTLAAIRESADRLAPEQLVQELVEQDFGAWEGRDPAALPWPRDAGLKEMAAFAPPDGENFSAMASRVGGAIERLTRRFEGKQVLVCAHAGSIRAALVLAMGAPEACGLAFDIRPISLTRLTAFGHQGWRIDTVNETPVESPTGIDNRR